MIYGLRQKEETEEANLWEYRLKGIIQAILSTGDGKAPETAWFVIYPADEYNIVNRQGFTATEFTFVEPYFDYISIEKNPLKIEGFYFNVKKLLKEYNRKISLSNSMTCSSLRSPKASSQESTKSNLSPCFNPSSRFNMEGNTVPMMTSEGYRINGSVLKVTNDKVLMDFNHPLAGDNRCRGYVDNRILAY